MNNRKRTERRFILAMAMALAGLASTSSHAQLPAAQQASLIVPYPAGSAFDVTARQIQPELGRALNKTIIVENIGGASGSIGAQRLLSAFSKRAGIAVTHVPYKGGAPVMQDLMGRQVDLTVLPLIPSYIQAAQEKKIKVLAVLGPARHGGMPDVPSVDEFPSVKGLHYSMWTGLFVPTKFPVASAAVIGNAANAIVASPSFRAWAEERGNSAGKVMDLDQAAAFYRQESERFLRVAAEIGLESK